MQYSKKYIFDKDERYVNKYENIMYKYMYMVLYHN